MIFYDLIKINETLLTFYYLWDDSDEKVIRASFSKKIIKNFKKKENSEIKRKFELYFLEKRELPKINYKFETKITDFELKVLKETEKIKYGQLITYKELAKRIHNPNAFRAVGNALGKNPLPVIIPCHRVISVNGLGGFTGGLHIKKFLLKLES